MTLILDKENPLATKVQFVCGDGRTPQPARILCVDLRDSFPVVAAVTSNNGDYEFCVFCSTDGNTLNKTRLINAPVTHKRWVNMYRYADGPISGAVFETRFEADLHNSGLVERIACKEIEFKEGDGL